MRRSVSTGRLAALVVATVMASVGAAGAGGADDASIRTLPASRGGQDVVGTKLPRLSFDAVFDAAGKTRTAPRDRVTLYRWWTDSCPWCEASLPALEKLRAAYEPRGLEVVAVYHPKPARRVEAEQVREAARARGFRGTVAIDADWSELRRAYLDRERRKATSITLLVDREGVVRFVHPGPVFFPSDDPADEQEDEDYQLIEAAVDALLPRMPPATRPADPGSP